jgi:hypothetical protein
VSLVGLANWFTKTIEHTMRQLVLYFTSAEHVLFQAMEKKDLLTGDIELTITESNLHLLSSVQGM